MYTVYYLDNGRVRKIQCGFSTLESIHQNHALLRVQKGSTELLSHVGGVLDDIAELAEKGLVDTDESDQESGDRLPGMV